MEDDTIKVEVLITLTVEQMETLTDTVDPLQPCEDYGIGLYLMAHEFVKAIS